MYGDETAWMRCCGENILFRVRMVLDVFRGRIRGRRSCGDEMGVLAGPSKLRKEEGGSLRVSDVSRFIGSKMWSGFSREGVLVQTAAGSAVGVAVVMEGSGSKKEGRKE